MDISYKCEEILTIVKQFRKSINKTFKRFNTLAYLVHKKIYHLINIKYKKCSKEEGPNEFLEILPSKSSEFISFNKNNNMRP